MQSDAYGICAFEQIHYHHTKMQYLSSGEQINTKSNELFPLEDPDNWVYRVQSYSSSLSQLQISVANHTLNRKYIITFVGVEFFDGPIDWSGKGFLIGDKEECLQILRKMEAHKDTEASSLDIHNLFVVEPEYGHRIRIVASGRPSLTEGKLY